MTTATTTGVKRRKLSAGERPPANQVRRLGNDLFGLRTKAAVVDAPAIDTRRMCVPCTITTQNEDRYGDIVVTAGIDLAFHRMAPAVLLNHGLGGGTPLDIARAEDGAGRYTVTAEKGRARSVSWFSEKIQDSEQCFALIQEGMLRGVSIGFRMKRFECRKDAGSPGGLGMPSAIGTVSAVGMGDGPGLLIVESELVEYSHCPIGVNPYALVDRVVGKSICGRPLSARIMKSLSPHFPALRTQVRGGWEGQQQGQQQGGQEDPMAGWLPGAKVLATCYSGLSSIGSLLVAETPRQEDDKVRECMAALGESLGGMLDAVAETFAERYPDHDLRGEGQGEEDEAQDEAQEKGQDGAKDETMAGYAPVGQVGKSHSRALTRAAAFLSLRRKNAGRAARGSLSAARSQLSLAKDQAAKLGKRLAQVKEAWEKSRAHNAELAKKLDLARSEAKLEAAQEVLKQAQAKSRAALSVTMPAARSVTSPAARPVAKPASAGSPHAQAAMARAEDRIIGGARKRAEEVLQRARDRVKARRAERAGQSLGPLRAKAAATADQRILDVARKQADRIIERARAVFAASRGG